ncbi:MAPEG family protein [Rubellimicrobium rubrum]|uniref:MAPEG family protein n=1 Tax=Rubellimicrobium rubrum TaxID=2585369 RepID=A0A5C4MZX3_9RHOB|nr:MAPEG family protein [Rubellimicrobium rubrum]TNC51866.1 MAPEG family protein [Rubellimicrobium rubrum]
MTAELTALAFAALVQFGQLGVFGYFVRQQGNIDYQVSNRDEPPPHRGRAARAQRAMSNHTENLILFAIAVVVVSLGEETSRLTAVCAWLYVIARVLYVPAYVLGLARLRSACWGVGWVSTLLMILAALF